MTLIIHTLMINESLTRSIHETPPDANTKPEGSLRITRRREIVVSKMIFVFRVKCIKVFKTNKCFETFYAKIEIHIYFRPVVLCAECVLYKKLTGERRIIIGMKRCI